MVEGLGALRGVPSRRKVLILLTDGRDEPGVPRPVAPLTAAEMARDLGVTLHAIAVGRPAAPDLPKYWIGPETHTSELLDEPILPIEICLQRLG